MWKAVRPLVVTLFACPVVSASKFKHMSVGFDFSYRNVAQPVVISGEFVPNFVCRVFTYKSVESSHEDSTPSANFGSYNRF